MLSITLRTSRFLPSRIEIDSHELAKLAEPLQRICADADVAFIVNDSVSLAKRLGADGVHLGQKDGDPREAREVLGPSVQIGVTCHDSRHLAMEAGERGADYVAFGAFYPTTTKAVEHHPEPSILSWWASMFELPSVAIGGITPVNAPPLVAAGADFLAVSGAVWGGDEAAAVRLIELVHRWPPVVVSSSIWRMRSPWAIAMSARCMPQPGRNMPITATSPPIRSVRLSFGSALVRTER